MHEMAVYVDETGPIGRLVDEVILPDLVVEGARLLHAVTPTYICSRNMLYEALLQARGGGYSFSRR
jgi:hypothetical protein